MKPSVVYTEVKPSVVYTGVKPSVDSAGVKPSVYPKSEAVSSLASKHLLKPLPRYFVIFNPVTFIERCVIGNLLALIEFALCDGVGVGGVKE